MASSSSDPTVCCILSTVRKAARFAVKVASIKTTNSQYAETYTVLYQKKSDEIDYIVTRTRAESARGASPPPWGVKLQRANHRDSFRVNRRGAGWAGGGAF